MTKLLVVTLGLVAAGCATMHTQGNFLSNEKDIWANVGVGNQAGGVAQMSLAYCRANAGAVDAKPVCYPAEILPDRSRAQHATPVGSPSPQPTRRTW